MWLSRIDKLHCPDQLVFDLDPSSEDFGAVKATAQSFRKLLHELELPAYIKTTGSRGFHVAVTLDRGEDFDSVRAFARRLAEIVVMEDPKSRTLELRKGKRGERVFVDINRNAYAQTVAPAFAVRARPGAPVSTTLNWSELSKKDLQSDGVNIRSIFGRLEKVETFGSTPSPSKKARQKIEKLNVTRRISQQEEFHRTAEPPGRPCANRISLASLWFRNTMRLGCIMTSGWKSGKFWHPGLFPKGPRSTLSSNVSP